MTVSSDQNRATHVGNDVTTDFTFPYKFFADTDLEVYIDDVLQTLTTDYTVSGAGNDAGGTVSFVTAPATGEDIVLVRVLPITQEIDYVEGDPFPAETHEEGLDRGTMVDQQLQEAQGRSLQLSVSDISGASTTIPTPSANSFLQWNDTGTALQNVNVLTSGSVVTTPFTDTLLDDTTASEFMDTLGFSTFFKTLVDDADAATFRTSIGAAEAATLGDLATANAGLGVSISGSDLDMDINELTEEAAITSGDFVPFYDTTAAALRKVDLDDLVAQAQTFVAESLAAEGYVEFANGLQVQWGQTGTGFSGTETLPVAMNNALWIVVATNERNSSSPGSDEEIRVHSFTTTQFGWFHIQGVNFNHYIAIGN